MSKKKNLKMKEQSITFHTQRRRPLVIDLSYEGVLKAVKLDDFTCYFKDANHYAKEMKNVWNFIRECNDKSDDKFITNAIFKNHSHRVNDNDILKLRKILAKKLESSNISSKIADTIEQMQIESWFQIGLNSNKIRLYGELDVERNIFKVYIIDFYHLIYPSVNYNHEDRSNYRFCPEGV